MDWAIRNFVFERGGGESEGIFFLRKNLRGWGPCHTGYGMKMTMHIDEALLARVMAAHGCESKTEAVDLALREMARKAGFRAMVAAASPFSPAELRAAVAPSYDVAALRAAEPKAAYKARRVHGKRKRSGR